MTTSVVVVNWNGGAHVLACLESLARQTVPPQEMIVVDNASEDGSDGEIVRRFPDVHLLRNDHNVGYGGGVNRGVARARGTWVALLNNDAIADPRWLEHMLAAGDRWQDCGMVACKIYLDRERRVLDKVGHRIALDGQNFGRGHGMEDRGQYDRLDEVAWPDGCASLWRRDVFLQVGGVDEEFFAYADDADLAIRFRLAGWRCALAPDAIVEHRHSQSLGAHSARKIYLVERNRIWLALKYFPWWLLVLNPFLWAWRATVAAVAAWSGEGLWARVPAETRRGVRAAVLRAQMDGWRAWAPQLKKRHDLVRRCGPKWHSRMWRLLRSAHVSLANVARGTVV